MSGMDGSSPGAGGDEVRADRDPSRRVLEVGLPLMAGGGVFLVLRHIHAADGRVVRSRLRAAFADPEDAEEWRQRWTEEDMEFEERVETMYCVFEREADRAVPDRGDPLSPSQEWMAAGAGAVEEWMARNGYDEAFCERLRNADRMERARHYVEWVEVTPPGGTPIELGPEREPSRGGSTH